MRIIPRAEWGARHDNGAGSRPLPATQAWLHHSVTIAPDLLPPFDDDYAAIRDLEAIGESRFGRGMSYTRLFTPVGLIFEGHGIDRVGSHTANRNTVAVGYCLVGNYDTTEPTEAQLRALAWCLQHDHANGWLDQRQLDGGHRDLKATACPGGRAYAAIPTINQLAAGGPVTEDHMTPDQEARLVGKLDQLIKYFLNSAASPNGQTVYDAIWRAEGKVDGIASAVQELKATVEAMDAVVTPEQLDHLADTVAARLPAGLVDDFDTRLRAAFARAGQSEGSP